MSGSGRVTIRSLAIVTIATLLIATHAVADTGTSLGDRSGEGSTPFTGLAQSPEANLFTGALTTRIPIKIPPGRKGMTPQLALRYSSAGGPTVFGHGWNLPIGRIDRSTKWGVPRCTGSHTNDFVLALPSGGATELVEDPPGSDVYRPSVEESWVEARRHAATNSWTVRDRSGLRYTFGDHSSARVATTQDGPALELRPDGRCELTSSWMLTHIEDANGNMIDVEWLSSNNLPMPSRVLYGGNSNGIDHFYRIHFAYVLRPPASFITSHRLGVEQRIVYRLSAVSVLSDVPAPDTAVRSYEFHYFDDDVSSSLLSTVVATHEPTQTFVYSPPGNGHDAAAEAISIAVPSGHEYMRRWTDSLEVFDSILDMNGDGKLDLVQSGSFPWNVYLGQSDGSDSFGFAAVPIPWHGDNTEGNGQIRNVWITSGPCDENGWACAVVDTFDITGDGRADYVVARDPSQPWQVYPGELRPDGNWGFAETAIAWPAPDRMIRRTKNGRTYRDVVDVSGDGLPDFVDVVDGVWSVWLNHGVGFETQPLPSFHAPVSSITRESDGSVRHLMSDFGGDGLPDMLVHADAGSDPLCMVGSTHRHDCMLVYHNTGQGFSETPDVIELPLWTDGLSVRDGHEVVADLVDINGDSLPDWVEVAEDGASWNVLINLGGTLSPVAYETAAPHDAYAWHTWPGGAGPLRATSGHKTEIDLVDLNGDGFVDRVAAGDDTWQVQLNTLTQKPNLLWMMENGLGGTNTIVYEPTSRFDHGGDDGAPDLPFINWVVAGTRLSDGLCTVPAQANPFDRAENPCIDQGHELISFFDYQDGLLGLEYATDGNGRPVALVDRGFHGFRRVVRRDVDGNETANTFGQSPIARGRPLELFFYAGDTESGSLVRYEVNSWSTRPASALRDQVWLGRNVRLTFDLGGIPHGVSTENHDVDEYGNVLHTSIVGNHRARIDTYTEYALPFGHNDCFPLDRPSRIRTEDASGLLDDRQYLYDGAPLGALSAANLTSIRAWLDSESDWITSEYEHDPYGNLVLARNPNQIETTIDYDDGHGTFLYPIIETNGVGHQTVTVTDYRYGKPAVTWGADGPATATLFLYDDAGRLVCEARPGDSTGGCTFTTSYQFADEPGETSSVTVERKQSGYATGRTTTAHFDALGRERFSDSRAVVAGAVMTIRRNHIELDAGGRVREKFYPYRADAPVPTNGSTTFDYHLNGAQRIDPLGRIHRTTHSDGTTVTVEYHGERKIAFDEEGNRSDRVYDALDRVVREEVYADGAVYSSSRTIYDGMGRVVATVQNDSSTPLKSFTYDSLGRRTSVTDRDSGTWTYGYDHAGNLLYRDDPKPNQHTQYCYDGAGRQIRTCSLPEDFTAIYSCASFCSAEQTVYTYDDPSVPFSTGRLTEVTDQAGRFRVTAYDPRGRRLATEREIDVDGTVTTARFEYEYNDTDEVVAIRYPDGEVVSTTYDESGRPIGLTSDDGDVYISGVWYDELGRATSVWHGNGARDDRSYFDAAERHRLSALGTTVGGHLEISHFYEYTPRGQIASISDLDFGPAGNNATYEYDPLGRLIHFDHFDDQLDRTYQYDKWGNLTRKGSLDLEYGDPTDPATAPHQIIAVDGLGVEYDKNGNRTSDLASRSFSYDGGDRLREITLAGETVRFLYDHEGVRRARVVDDGGPQAVNRYYNHLVHTDAQGRTVKTYFLGGVRIASRTHDDSGWELAASERGTTVAGAWHGRPVLVLTLGDGAAFAAVTACAVLLLVLSILPRGRTRRVVGVKVGRRQAAAMTIVFATTVLPWPVSVRPAAAQCSSNTPTPAPSESLVHFHSDHLGSIQMITSALGEVVEHTRYMPYGEIRGRWNGSGVPIGNPSTEEVHYGYSGHEREASSGLIYAGARFYDPLLGSFLTPDPAGEFSNPYSYVGWDPVNGNDPTGECELLCLLAVSFVVGFVIGAADAIISGASVGDALKAGLISGATSVLSGAALGPAGSAAGALDGWSRAVGAAVRLAANGYGLYNTVESFRNGEYVAGVRGALGALYAAFGGLAESQAGVGAKQSALPGNQVDATIKAAPPDPPGTPRITTVDDKFPPAPQSGTVARIVSASTTIFGIKVEVGTAWAIDSTGARMQFDIFAIGVESEVLELAAGQALLITDAASVHDLAGSATSFGGNLGPGTTSFGGEYTSGEKYMGVTLFGGVSYGIAPVGAYGMKETWTPSSS